MIGVSYTVDSPTVEHVFGGQDFQGAVQPRQHDQRDRRPGSPSSSTPGLWEYLRFDDGVCRGRR
jgi:hypothetical protein